MERSDSLRAWDAGFLVFPLPVLRAGLGIQLGPVSGRRGRQSLFSFSTDVPRKRNWSAAGGCAQAGLGAGALALCSYLGTEDRGARASLSRRVAAVGNPSPRARGRE